MGIPNVVLRDSLCGPFCDRTFRGKVHKQNVKERHLTLHNDILVVRDRFKSAKGANGQFLVVSGIRISGEK